MRTATLLLITSGIVFAQSERTACSLSIDIESEYRSLPSMSDLSLSWEERYGPRRELAKKYPTNWPLQLALQEPLLNLSVLGNEWDSAIEHYRALPDHLLGGLLEARLLAHLQRKKSRAALDHVLELAKDSPWPHLAMLEWATDRRNGDTALAQSEFIRFREICPGDRRIFRQLSVVREREELNRQIRALRGALEMDKKRGFDEEDLEMLRTAWTFERITYSQDHFDEFRKMVRSDLEFLREHPNYDSGLWDYLVESGYTEPSVVKSIRDEILEHAPNGYAAYKIEKDRWAQNNPQPTATATQPGQPIPQSYMNAMEAYGARRAPFMLSLLERFWGKPYAAPDALGLLWQPHLPAKTFERLADFVLSDADRFPDQGTRTPPVQFQVVEAYINRKARLEQVPALVQKGLHQFEVQTKYERDSDAFDEQTRRNIEQGMSDNKMKAQELLIGHAIASGEKERARVLLDDFRHNIEESKSASANNSTASWRSYEFSYRMLAREASVEVPPESEVLFAGPPQEDRLPMVPFEVRDLSGKKWNNDSLLGKVTYVSTWRVGCGGCAQGAQQLYERWKNRSDRAVLTISVDDNPAVAESFMKQNGYTFPAVYGMDMAAKILGIAGWPLQSFIDPQGRRVRLRPPHASTDTIPQIEEIADNISATQ